MDEIGAVRIGDGERAVAVEALAAHREAGRLTPTEYEDRQVVASKALTWAEIGPLFADLPAPRPVGMPADAPVVAPSGPGQVVEQVAGPPRGLLGDVVPARYRDTVMALTPFAAVLLFFVTRSWLWFLAIPVMGILLYGAEGKPKKPKKPERPR